MKQVLIVDDSEQIRERLAAMLTESNQIRIVGQAGDGDKVMDAVQHLKPDTVILDIRLPGSNGIELLKKIKARYSQVTVIMLTNYDFAKYRQRCKELGADHFLNKTLESDKIIATIVDSGRDEKMCRNALASKEKNSEIFRSKPLSATCRQC